MTMAKKASALNPLLIPAGENTGTTLLLKGWINGEVGNREAYREFEFTLGERALALGWAKLWDERGECPRLVVRTYNDPEQRVLYNWRNTAKRQKKEAA
jgi:hypothetical protein